jgi:hypothetical protein
MRVRSRRQKDENHMQERTEGEEHKLERSIYEFHKQD